MQMSKRLKDLKGEAGFLAGRHHFFKEVSRFFRMGLEFVRGYWGFRGVGPAVTLFGSARVKEGSRYYELARRVGSAIAREGFVVVTGGGPGIMEAASRGAKEAGGRTLGANIILPFEQRANPWIDRVVVFYYFFVRKVMLVKYSYAYVVMPGGLGTLDEMTEALTLIQTQKLYDFPVVLVGVEYWKGLTTWLQSTPVAEGMIAKEDLRFFSVTDDPEEVVRLLKGTATHLGLGLRPPRAQGAKIEKAV